MSKIAAIIGNSTQALTREFNLITHNLANVSTAGYKRRCNAFTKAITGADAVATEAKDDDLNTAYDFSQGEFNQTGRTLDFALAGNGFFVVETPDGPLYTRNGMFRLDADGKVVDSVGRTIAGKSGPISIPSSVSPSRITVSSDGSITADGVTIDKFELVDFPEDRDKLTAAGMNCFQITGDIKSESSENLIVKQGFLESSNVKMVEELVDMITVSRMYEANMKFLSASKDTSKSLLNVALG
ncbi:MAG: flagellar hook basal-body protein [Anaerohalosphaeraceae bacterium]|nr:flagellar hook basal-body protein [Anaerohalosphaeraceae bacterium]